MDSITKRKILIIAIIILFVINISALATIIYNNHQVKKRFVQDENMRKETQNRGMNFFFRDELNLTDEQFEEFKIINKKYFNKSQDIAFKLHNNRILLLEELAKINPNLETMDQVAKEIGELHYELKLNTIEHFMELKNLCNKEQQEYLQHFFMKIIEDQDNSSPRRRNRHDMHQRTERSGRPDRTGINERPERRRKGKQPYQNN